MSISPIRSSENGATSLRGTSRPKAPQGVAAVRDRIESANPQEPPSLFKMYLFQPIIDAFWFLIRGIFRFVDFLRRSAFDDKPAEPALTREEFLRRLSAAPEPEQLLVQFKQVYSVKEQAQVYQSIGEAHKGKVSWKEVLWTRNSQENIALGRSLTQQNPFLLREYLF